MSMVNTKAELLQEMKRLGACSEATDWVTSEEGTADEIWQRCTEISWLIWFAGRRKPTAIAAFARRCAERAEGYAAMAANADYATMAARAANADYAAMANADYATMAARAAYAARAARAAADYAARAANTTMAARAAANAARAERALQLADLHQLLPSA